MTSVSNINLVSVIIPCYNHGEYLSDAIESVTTQNYPSIEIVVIDDGSTDNTNTVAKQYKDVKYIYQQNQGLSAARNTGVNNSNGEFLIFLDADDWLLPGSILINVQCLLQHQELAFVSGGHDKVFVKEGITKEDIIKVESDHYLHFLMGNYIGMHATVMYRRWVFEEMLFDTSLKTCEDYDLYLRITRKYPVLHHSKKIAAYRIHTSNMSANIQVMLLSVLNVLGRQKNKLRSSTEKAAYKKGRRIWKDYYMKELYKTVIFKNRTLLNKSSLIFLKYKPSLFLRYILSKPLS